MHRTPISVEVFLPSAVRRIVQALFDDWGVDAVQAARTTG